MSKGVNKGVNKVSSLNDNTTPPVEKGVNEISSFDDNTTPPIEKGVNEISSFDDNTTPPIEKGVKNEISNLDIETTPHIIKKDLEYYMNLDWTLIEGTDLDFNGNPYHYIEIKEIPSFAFCAKTREKALENYKKQLRLSLMLMLEDGDHIVEPGEETEDDIDWESICP